MATARNLHTLAAIDGESARRDNARMGGDTTISGLGVRAFEARLESERLMRAGRGLRAECACLRLECRCLRDECGRLRAQLGGVREATMVLRVVSASLRALNVSLRVVGPGRRVCMLATVEERVNWEAPDEG